MALAGAAGRKGKDMDFSFASVFVEFLISLMQYLFYGTNPFSVLFYIGLSVGLVDMCAQFFRRSL